MATRKLERSYMLAVRTYPETKAQLMEIVKKWSEKDGTRYTQAQVLERLVSEKAKELAKV